MKTQPVRESDYSDITSQIERIFYEVIFRPILDLLSPHNAQVKAAAREFRNAAPSNAALIAALNTGRIQYADGVFSGDFNSVLSRALKGLGAKFSRVTKSFTLTPDLVPPDVRAAAHHYADWTEDLHDMTQKRLDEIQAGLEKAIDQRPVNGSIMIGNIQLGMQQTAGDALGNLYLTDASREKLKKQYAERLKPYIKNFSEDTIKELREAVETNALTGYRFDTLIKRIQSRYDVSKSKAEFLARTETARYVSKHRQVRFEEAGITQYIWRTAGDARVREDHRKLNGQTFSYKHPPIIDERTGEKGNPGEIYNCRCFPFDEALTFSSEILKGFKRLYKGTMLKIVLASGKTIRCTPNHQMLTLAGWKAAQDLDKGDSLVNLSLNSDSGIEAQVEHKPSTIGEVVDSLGYLFGFKGVDGAGSQFHGDGSDCEVSIVTPNRNLLADIEPKTTELLEHSIFADTLTNPVHEAEFAEALSGRGTECHSALRSEAPESKMQGFCPPSNRDACLNHLPANNMPRNSKSLRNGKLALPTDIVTNDGYRVDLKASPEATHGFSDMGVEASLSEVFREAIRTNADSLPDFYECHPRIKHTDSVIDLVTEDFFGHVYNLETKTGWYCINGVIAHNCVAEAIIPDYKNYTTPGTRKNSTRKNSTSTDLEAVTC